MKNTEDMTQVDEALRRGGFKSTKQIAENVGVEHSDVEEHWELFRAEVYELLDAGMASSEIAKTTGSTSRVIAAFRAARTRGLHRHEEEADEAIEVTAGLERDLQIAIRENINQLDPELSIVDGGKERTTAVGRIDITCADKDGSPVVIELKVGRARDAAVGQILGYMGAIADEESRAVRGILIAEEFDNRVIHAARAIQNLTLKSYVMRFSFQDVS